MTIEIEAGASQNQCSMKFSRVHAAPVAQPGLLRLATTDISGGKRNIGSIVGKAQGLISRRRPSPQCSETCSSCSKTAGLAPILEQITKAVWGQDSECFYLDGSVGTKPGTCDE